MRHLTNTYNPDLPDARMHHTHDHHDMANGQQAMDFAWNYHLRYISENVRGLHVS